MLQYLQSVFKVIDTFLKAESAKPPYPFDDEEGSAAWVTDREDVINQEAVNQQVHDWQKWTSRKSPFYQKSLAHPAGL